MPRIPSWAAPNQEGPPLARAEQSWSPGPYRGRSPGGVGVAWPGPGHGEPERVPIRGLTSVLGAGRSLASGNVATMCPRSAEITTSQGREGLPARIYNPIGALVLFRLSALRWHSDDSH